MTLRRRCVLAALLGLVLATSSSAWEPSPTHAADARPFRLPFGEPPGPDSWLLIQPYGNTAFAYRQRFTAYPAGQGLHFGVDLAARCGTPVLAIGDGVVVGVDSAFHGALPHNLMIDHPNGYASFYGHLLARPDLRVGQRVEAGEVVALSGDPDMSCASRPHLHLEVRSAPDHRKAFNPLSLIEADWHRIALVGGTSLAFEQDLAQPRRWQTLQDQPEVIFGGTLLNNYQYAWPPGR